jgi:hypothetical protein
MCVSDDDNDAEDIDEAIDAVTPSILSSLTTALRQIPRRASSTLKANPTLCTQIMSKPGEVGPPISSPIMACLLPGQRRKGGGGGTEARRA